MNNRIKEIIAISTIEDIEKLKIGCIPEWINNLNISITEKYALINEAKKI